MLGNDKNIEPEDLKRLTIFFVLATALYLAFYNFILEPQNRAIQEAARQDALIAQKQAALQQLDPTTATTPNQAAPIQQNREDIIATSPRITIDTNQIKGSITTKGARLDDIALKNYFDSLEKEHTIAVLSPPAAQYPRYIEYGWVSNTNAIQTPNDDTQWQIMGNDTLTTTAPVTLRWVSPQNVTFERTLSIDENFMITVKQRLINNSTERLTLHPYGLISQKGLPKKEGRGSSWLQHEGPIGYIGEDLNEVSYKDLRKSRSEEQNASQGWIGITDKYWFTGLIPPQGQNVKYSFRYAGTSKDKNNQGRYQSDFLAAPLTLESGQSGEVESRIFAGAKQVLLLDDYAERFDIPQFSLVVNFGWFWFLSIPFFHILHFLGEHVGNMGIAVIMLTVLIRGAAFPLMNASYKSFGKMKKVAPKVTELREKFGDDKQKLQAEMMQLYQKEGVNPMAGCFPILLQIPIFFALYKVLFVTIEIRHAPFYGWIQDLSAPDPTSVFNAFGLIPWDPPSFLMIGAWPCMMCLVMIVQKKLNPPPQDKIQRDIMNFFPFAITFALAQFASGLVIYWATSALIGVIQQMIIMRMMGVPIYLFGQSEDDKKLDENLDKGGAALHPLVDMAEQEAEDALFGEGENTKPDAIKPAKKKKSKKSKKKK